MAVTQWLHNIHLCTVFYKYRVHFGCFCSMAIFRQENKVRKTRSCFLTFALQQERIQSLLQHIYAEPTLGALLGVPRDGKGMGSFPWELAFCWGDRSVAWHLLCGGTSCCYQRGSGGCLRAHGRGRLTALEGQGRLPGRGA